MPGELPPAAGKKKGPGWLRGMDKKKKTLLGVGAAGAGLGAVMLLRRKGKTGAAADGQDPGMVSTGQAIAPAQFSDAGVGAYQNLQNEIEALGKQINDIGSAPTATTPPVSGNPANNPVVTRKGGLSTQYYGTKGKIYSLREVARRYAKNPNDPNSVSSELVAIVNANQSLRNRTTYTGGTRIMVPMS